MRQLGQSVLVLVLLLGAAQLVCAAPLPVDIHVMLDASTVSLAEAADRTLHALLPGDEVFLNTIDMPHVTLYLTQFEADNLLDLIATVGAVVANFTTCTAQLNNATAVGTYGMWMGPASPCLQLMSDSLVNATMQYIVPNQPIPSWINTLPEPLREEKIAMIEKYGSPNVFTQFQPQYVHPPMCAWSASLRSCSANRAPVCLLARAQRHACLGQHDQRAARRHAGAGASSRADVSRAGCGAGCGRPVRHRAAWRGLCAIRHRRALQWHRRKRLRNGRAAAGR